MALFNFKRHRRVIAGDSVDDDPLLSYDNVGWKPVSDEQDYDSLTNQYKHDAIAHRIVDKPAEDATKNGFRIVIPDDVDRQDFYQKQYADIKLPTKLCQQEIYRRMHGDAYLTAVVQEKNATGTDTPLVPQNVLAVTQVNAFGENHVDKLQTNDDPTSAQYGKEQAIVLRPTQSGYTIDQNGNQVPNQPNIKPIVIDQSRYQHTTMDKFEDDETGTSILTRCQDQLKAVEIALKSSGKMLREFTFKFFKSDALMAEGDEDFRRDKAEIGRVLNTEATVFGHAQDSIEKVSTPTNGINTLFDFVWQQLSAACGIPRSILLGEQAGTLAGASQDVINYYDSIKSIQTNLMKPEIEWITRLLMYAAGDDPDAIDWKIEFNPLQSLDDKTQSEVFVNNANALNTLITSGTIGPDEAKTMLQGQDNNPVSFMQTTGDSADITPNDIKNYKRELRAIKHGKQK